MTQRVHSPQLAAGNASELQTKNAFLTFEDSLQLAAGSFNFLCIALMLNKQFYKNSICERAKYNNRKSHCSLTPQFVMGLASALHFQFLKDIGGINAKPNSEYLDGKRS